MSRTRREWIIKRRADLPALRADGISGVQRELRKDESRMKVQSEKEKRRAIWPGVKLTLFPPLVVLAMAEILLTRLVSSPRAPFSVL